MYPGPVRRDALERLSHGQTLSQVSRDLGISRATLRDWRTGPPTTGMRRCPRCDEADLPTEAYAALLGYYLGDGCLSQAARYVALRISCDVAWPAVIEDVVAAVSTVHPARPVFRVPAPGVEVVQSHWQHWPCLFPQHGPGRKHEGPIVLEDWQRRVVEQHPGPLLRGLFHSDGCRVRNWATRTVAGRKKRYDYPRWQFTNVSADIRELCCWALDLTEIAWRQSNTYVISVSRRADVARLDELIGPKS